MNSSNNAYDRLGAGYTRQRKPDARIASQLLKALEGARSVLNVGAGTGSYEPAHVPVFAVEPSLEMIGQRANSANVIQAAAEALPFRDQSFDDVLAILTVHHWTDLASGLRECTRVARRKFTLLTWDPDSHGFWLTRDYFPGILSLDRRIFPSISELEHHLGPLAVTPVPVPGDCVDGFLGAYWRRPLSYLDAQVRSGMSSFARITNVSEGLELLSGDLESGEWQRKYGDLCSLETLDIGYRLVTTEVS